MEVSKVHSRYTCTLCGQDNLSVDGMKTHMMAVHTLGNTRCPLCDLGGVSSYELQYHVNTAHANILSPVASGHSSRKSNIEARTQQSQQSCAQNGSICSNANEHNDRMMTRHAEQTRSKTLLELSNQHALMNGDIANDLQTKDATGRKFKGEKKRMKEARTDLKSSPTESFKNEPNCLYYIPHCSSSRKLLKNEFPADMLSSTSSLSALSSSSSSSSSSSTQVMNLCKHDDETENDNLSISSVQSPVKKRMKRDTDASFTINSPSSINSSIGSVFSTIKNIILSPFKTPEAVPAQSASSLSSQGDQQLTVATSSSNSDVSDGSYHCPICSYTIADVNVLESHVDSHFIDDSYDNEILGRQLVDMDEGSNVKDDELIARQLYQEEKRRLEDEEKKQFQILQKKFGMDGSGNYKKQAEKTFDQAFARGQITVSDYHDQMHFVRLSLQCGIDDGQARTKGLIARLQHYYRKDVAGVEAVMLCTETSHYCASPGDKGWGCGYKNIQMLMTAMSNDPRFKKTVFNSSSNIPSISKLQQLIEKAWQQGFDPHGMQQLGGTIYDTRKWIGATEVVALFTSLNVRCKLMDFHHATGPDKTHHLMIQWIQQYFGLAHNSVFSKNKTLSNKLPLYLQHDGHSRTVIGYEQLSDGSIRLLIFDPSLTKKQISLLKAPELTGYALKPLRHTLANLKGKQYQIVCIQGNLADGESKTMKVLTSHRIP